jgi:hypothetical protein
MRSNFQTPVGHRQRVVKNRCVGEIAHAEIVEPLQRTRVKPSFLLVFHAKFAGEHALDLSTEISSPLSSENSAAKIRFHNGRLAAGSNRGLDFRHDAFEMLESLVDGE